MCKVGVVSRCRSFGVTIEEEQHSFSVKGRGTPRFNELAKTKCGKESSLDSFRLSPALSSLLLGDHPAVSGVSLTPRAAQPPNKAHYTLNFSALQLDHSSNRI